jgi:transposase
MSKSTNFSGTPIIKQILKYISPEIIYRTAREHKSDRYYKRFKTYDHLVTMIYAVLSGCCSLREVSSILLACEGRINHIGLKHFPKRSTLADANKKRQSEVFADIYYKLHDKYKKYLSDSSPIVLSVKNLHIIDSTTISLFSEILKAAGRNPPDGKRKGGIKVHTMINALEDVPCLIRMTSSATCDKSFLKEIDLKKGSIVVFDKGYNSFSIFEKWNRQGIYFVTRQHENAVWDHIEEYDINGLEELGVLSDEKIRIGKTAAISFEVRRIKYWNEEQGKEYVFITNNFDLKADQIALIYKKRWQIEHLFKRLKQNFPLKYFLGDNRNAIEIQIWVSLIIQLLMLVIQRIADKKWSFSNMVSIIRYHLMTYIDLIKFLNNPDASWEYLTTKPRDQLELLF